MHHNKKIKLIGIFDSCKNDKLVSIVSNNKQAEEWIVRENVLEHFEHFQLWVEMHNKKSDDFYTLCEYCHDVLPLKDKLKYKYGSIKLNLETVASMFRISIGCIPTGSSFETPEEYYNMIKRVAEAEKEEQNGKKQK